MIEDHSLFTLCDELSIPSFDIRQIYRAFDIVKIMAGKFCVEEIRCNIRTAKKFDRFGKTIFNKFWCKGVMINCRELYGYIFAVPIVIDKYMIDDKMVFISTQPRNISLKVSRGISLGVYFKDFR